MTLLNILLTESHRNPHHVLQLVLSPLQISIQLDQIIDLFDAAAKRNENTNQAIIAAWTYLTENSLWSCRYPNLHSFQTAIHFQETIQPILNQSQQLTSRHLGAYSTIFKNWSCFPTEIFPRNLLPHPISQHLARELARLSNVSTLEQAVSLIKLQRNQRINTIGARLTRFILTTDIRKTYETLQPPVMSLNQQIEVVIPCQPNTSPLDTEMPDYNQPDTQPIPSQTLSQTIRCNCNINLQEQLQNINNDTPLQRLHIFSAACHSNLSTLCWDHLRLLGRLTVGLYSNGIKRSELEIRFSHLFQNIHQYQSFILDNRTWFNKDTRISIPTDMIAPYRFFSDFLPTPKIHIQSIFSRLAGPSVRDSWLRDGNIIIPDLCSYLNTPDIRAAIDFEFNLYQHHFAEIPGQPSMGFLRNMFYSGIQQLVRQDPGWYAIQVAARPDHQWRLICYPYVAKFVRFLMNTGFFHVDINIDKLLSDGIGASQLTSSISLDKEYKDGCTIVVPGLFHHLKQWQARRKKRLNRITTKSSKPTTDGSKSYTNRDRRSFGKPQPCPCPAFGVRVTHPGNLHGSTKITARQRRVIYTWHTSIASNHKDLEIPGQHTWDELAACYRDLEAPSQGVGGESVTHSRPPFRFPAAVAMNSSSALCDALIGRRKWTDPSVIYEAGLILGKDSDVATQYIAHTRQILITNYLKMVAETRIIEPLVYPNNSFVLQHT
jgi:hypothetical protein